MSSISEKARSPAAVAAPAPGTTAPAARPEFSSLQQPAPEKTNLYAAWIGILLGFVTGTVQGSYFENPAWLGGYSSWPRRMLRLGHISLFALALISLAFVFSVAYLGLRGKRVKVCSRLFLTGQIAMPVVCYVCAFHENLIFLFAVPVLSLLAGALLFLWTSIRR